MISTPRRFSDSRGTMRETAFWIRGEGVTRLNWKWGSPSPEVAKPPGSSALNNLLTGLQGIGCGLGKTPLPASRPQ